MPLQELQVHLLQQQQAAVLAFAMVVHPSRLQRHNPALQLTLKIHLHIPRARMHFIFKQQFGASNTICCCDVHAQFSAYAS